MPNKFLFQKATLTLILLTSIAICKSQVNVEQWAKYQIDFTSEKTYTEPIYQVRQFYALFKSPTGRALRVNGFWDGSTRWSIRFAPDELGEWSYTTYCSDTLNQGLHNKSGNFTCTVNDSEFDIYKKGGIIHPPGTYYLSHQDGTPFFWTACTAWNGALKSTEAEWDKYLKHRVGNNYNVIQFVTTQWRGGDQNSLGQVAYQGSGRIKINPEFFQHMDQKVDKINEYGLVAAPVVLWALPRGDGRDLSPGYHLPIEEAVILAKYIVARYSGNQVVWLLGGDGQYYGDLEDRWKAIGRRVFEDIHHAPVTLHPHGHSWIGDIYADEDWMDIVCYQSSHSNAAGTVDWINKGPIASRWDKLPPRPIINMEPNYEEIHFTITDEDVRNASYWSIFATPPAGISYGANGIWPWLREGESILNHRDAPGTSTWEKSIEFPGSIQIGYLSQFIRQFEWWNLKPGLDLLVRQPGTVTYNHFVSLLRTEDYSTVLVYLPVKETIQIRNPQNISYLARWFNPVTNEYQRAELSVEKGLVEVTSNFPNDMLLIMTKK
ncbi:MAG: hypothetical protein DHS20C17_32510 [Cyclobacteriaceae bacterium]|nr:MAG: hypothetical protein DHS20C17_32510 [Cyclobacteriaceae bacterium]